MRNGDRTEALVSKPREAAKPRIIRFAIAIVGAAGITIGLMLFMQDLVSRFLERDPTRYFSISSFIPLPDRGRQLPNAPPTPASAPRAPVLDYEEPSNLSVEIPVVEVETDAPTAAELNLEE